MDSSTKHINTNYFSDVFQFFHCSVSTFVQFVIKETPKKETTCKQVRGTGCYGMSPISQNYKSIKRLANSSHWYSGCAKHGSFLLKPGVVDYLRKCLILRNSDILWLSSFPDLLTCDFFFRGHFKNKVYISKHPTMEELKETIEFKEAIAKIYTVILYWTICYVMNRLKECLHNNRANLHDVIFNK